MPKSTIDESYVTLDVLAADTIANGEHMRHEHLVTLQDRSWSLKTGFGYPGVYIGLGVYLSAGGSAQTIEVPIDWPEETWWMQCVCSGSGSGSVLITSPLDSVGGKFEWNNQIATPVAAQIQKTDLSDSMVGDGTYGMASSDSKHLYDPYAAETQSDPLFRTLTVVITPSSGYPFALHGIAFHPVWDDVTS